MSRVAQLDSIELENEIHNLTWRDFETHIQPEKYKEEFKFLIDTLVFYFGATYLTRSYTTTTYASALSGVSFKCRKRTLFLITVFTNYLQTKLSHAVFNSSKQWALRLYSLITNIYVHFDLLNTLHFLMCASSKTPTFLSPLHRLFGVVSTTDTIDSKDFYQNTVYAGIEFQNRQLLWNAILEIFNMTLLNNAAWLKAKPKRTADNRLKAEVCPHCGEFPVNPYSMACCSSIYCYICVVTALDGSYCDKCEATKNLSAKPLY